MAVFNPQGINLEPFYANMQRSIERRGEAEARGASSKYAMINAGAETISKIGNYLLEKEINARYEDRNKIKIPIETLTPMFMDSGMTYNQSIDLAKKVNELGIDPESGMKIVQEKFMQAKKHKSIEDYRNTLPEEERKKFDASMALDEGGTGGAMAKQQFAIPKASKQIKVVNKSFPSGFEYYDVNPDGTKTPTGLEAPGGGGRTATQSAKLKSDLIEVSSQLKNFNEMEKLLEKTTPGAVGKGGSIVGKMAGLMGVSMNTENVTYDDMRPAFATAVYKTTTGDTKLSDADAASRALPMVPSLSNSMGVRKYKMAIIRDAMEKKKELLKSFISNPDMTPEEIELEMENFASSLPTGNPLVAQKALSNIPVINPKGERGFLDQSELQEALDNGWELDEVK